MKIKTGNFRNHALYNAQSPEASPATQAASGNCYPGFSRWECALSPS